MKVSDYVIGFLKHIGIKHVFMVTGGSCMHLTDSLNNVEGIDYVCCQHEQAAAMAAEAYARITENIGCVLVTSGPGGTNAVTGVASAWIDGIPMIVISGQAGSNALIGNTGERQVGVQELNLVDVARPMTKYAKLIMEAEYVPAILAHAHSVAISGKPGPVWVDIPVDIQGRQVGTDGLEKINKAPFVPFAKPIDVEYVVNCIQKAKRPLLYVGHGVRLASAMDEFVQLVACGMQCPVQTTWGAVDFLDDNSIFYAGHPGMWGQRWANKITQMADLILCIGTRLSLPQTGYNVTSWGRNAVKIVVDIDVPTLARVANNGCVPVHADAKYFIKALIEALSDYDGFHGAWIQQCQEVRAAYPVVLPEYYSEKLNSYVFLEKLSERISEDYIITSDVGTSFAGMFPVWKVKYGQRLINQSGLSSMGHALPSTIGAWFASDGKRPILCLCGDGGFSMNIQELQTIAHHQIPVKIFVFANEGYLTIKHTLSGHFGRLTACDPDSGVSMPNFVEVACGYGIEGYHLFGQKPVVMDGVIHNVLNTDGPVLCAVHTDPMQAIIPRLKTKLDDDGNFVLPEFDDMWPQVEKVVCPDKI